MSAEETAVCYILAEAFKYDPMESVLRVWRFQDAPAELQALSEHGGDEDWLLLIPPDYPHGIDWAEVDSCGWNNPFGVCKVSSYPLPNGWEVRIGAHS